MCRDKRTPRARVPVWGASREGTRPGSARVRRPAFQTPQARAGAMAMPPATCRVRTGQGGMIRASRRPWPCLRPARTASRHRYRLAERARAGRSAAEALPSSPHPLPPLRAPLGGRSRDDCAKRARLLLRKRSVRAPSRWPQKKKLFPPNYTSFAIFWSHKHAETCRSRRVCRGHTSNA